MKKSENKTWCRGRGVCDHAKTDLIRTWSQTPRPRHPTGVVLLEVLTALTLFVIAAAVIGSAMSTSMRATADMRLTVMAANIAQSVLAELEAGSAEIVDTPATAFEDAPDGWTYQIVTDEITDTPGLKKVTVIVAEADSPDSHTHQLTQWILDRTTEVEPVGETGS